VSWRRTEDVATLGQSFGFVGLHARVLGSSREDWLLKSTRIGDGIVSIECADGDPGCRRSSHRSVRSWLQLLRAVLLSVWRVIALWMLL
jgi:hypothetical protein